MPNLPKNRYAEVAPARSCLSPSPSRKAAFFPKGRKEVILHTPRTSVDEVEKTEDETQDKVNNILLLALLTDGDDYVDRC